MVNLSTTAAIAGVMIVVGVGFVFAALIATIAEYVWNAIDFWALNRKTRKAWRNLKAKRMR
jgi:hypothetical protein